MIKNIKWMYNSPSFYSLVGEALNTPIAPPAKRLYPATKRSFGYEV